MSAAPALQRDAVPGLQALDRLPTTSTPTVPMGVRAADVFKAAVAPLRVPLNRKTTQNEVQPVWLDTLEPTRELLPVAGLSAYVVKPRRDPPDVAHVVMRSGRERWVIQEGHTRLGAAVLRGDETLPARVWEFEQADTGDLVPVLRGLHRRGVQLTLRDAKPGLHPDWQLGDEGLTRHITFPNLRACATFISALMDAANAANHHPDVQNDNCDVTVTFITHATGTVTAKDYAGAEEADRLAGEALLVLSGDDVAALLLDWDEELHPRADDGKFTESGDTGGGGKTSKVTWEKQSGFRNPLKVGKKPDGKQIVVTELPSAAHRHEVIGDREPADLAAQMVEHIPGDLTVKWAGYKRGEGPVLLMSVDRQDGLSIQRSFQRDPEGHLVVHHDLFSVPTNAQGKGIAKALLRESLDTYKALGVDEVKTFANLEVGGYAWARFGFTADKPEYLASDLEKALRTQTGLSGAQRQGLMDLIAQHRTDPRLPWHIAGAVTSDGRKIGKELMLNRAWDGTLDMHDAEAVARMEHYVRTT